MYNFDINGYDKVLNVWSSYYYARKFADSMNASLPEIVPDYDENGNYIPHVCYRYTVYRLDTLNPLSGHPYVYIVKKQPHSVI